jgi:D-glycero-alpha-D-manno-heptose-7-phosphate kinase
MSFVGGGSDLPAYYKEFGGAVVSTAIDKYVYVTVNKKFDDGIRIGYSRNEEVTSIDDVQHPLVKATMQMLGIQGGVEITTIADIPSQGTGLGSSSSFTVGLINALSAFKGQYVSAGDLGGQSSKVEIELCKEPIGKQDQYAAAFGGFNYIEFCQDGSVVVSPIISRPETMAVLQRNCLMFYTGVTRSASNLLKRQCEDIASQKDKQDVMHRMVALARILRDELQMNNLRAFGDILHENWELKKSITSGISNESIDGWYSRARAAGALGGKLLGAGAGGFLMFYAPQDRHEAIRQALSDLRPVPFVFEPLGSRIIFYHS